MIFRIRTVKVVRYAATFSRTVPDKTCWKQGKVNRDQVVTVHPGREVIALLILKLGSRWREWSISRSDRFAFEKTFTMPVEWEVVWP